MALAPDPTRRWYAALSLPLLVALLLLAGACSDDSGDDDSGADDGSPSTTAAPDGSSEGDDETTTTTEAGTGDGVGTVEVDGESYALDSITGITSCDLEDPEGDLTVAAESADGDVFLRLDAYGSDPDSNEFSVTVGEVEYVSASPADVAYTLDGQTVSGTIPVEPLFEEGTAQDVTFEVTCP